MKFDVTILGCGAATPTLRRGSTAQLVNLHDKQFLIDCGEGTQLQLRRFKIKFQKINHIFISHLHGDHYLGLIGLISSMHLLGRKTELNIYGPPQLKELIDINLKHSDTFLNFKLIFHPMEKKEKQLIHEDKTLEVYAYPLKHRISCFGYAFREKQKSRRILKDKIKELDIGISEIVKLKQGDDVEREDGSILKSNDCTLPPYKPRQYAYCSDTAYSEKVIEFVEGSDLMYHESTFLEVMKDRAKQTFHSTAIQAATIAEKANVHKLILGHYSSRYTSVDQFKQEAGTVHKNVVLAFDGLKLSIV